MTQVADVQTAIECVLKERLQRAGLNRIEVTEGEDFQGDPALFIDTYFDLTETALDPAQFDFLTTRIREAIEPLGESRFPHLRHHFDAHQKVAGQR